MGLLRDSLTTKSAYGAKRTGLWEQLEDEVAGAMWPGALDAIWERYEARPQDLPGAWHEPLAELIEKRREELKAENITEIMRDRHNF